MVKTTRHIIEEKIRMSPDEAKKMADLEKQIFFDDTLKKIPNMKYDDYIWNKEENGINDILIENKEPQK